MEKKLATTPISKRYSDMYKFFQMCVCMHNLLKSQTSALSLTLAIFAFVPESVFGIAKLLENCSDGINIILVRILTATCIFVVVRIASAIYFKFCNQININGNNYSICIEYGDLLQKNNCKKVIPFDECFTTTVGNAPSDIKPTSICGQYLNKKPIQNIQKLIDNAQLEPAEMKSKYKNKTRYDSGKLVPNGDDLLMAFAKLDKEGLGKFFSYDEFLECLSILWKEIDKYYGQKDVCIPILGSGITRIGDVSLTQQELLDVIVGSYKLSSHKIKLPYKLKIICKKCPGFSLNKVGKSI